MILLDTNVISEPLRPAPDPAVLAWLDRQNAETLFLAAISLAELRYGVAALPEGRRKTGLTEALETRILSLFSGRVLAFDSSAASAYAVIRTRAKSAGQTLSAADGYIAATAAAQGFMVATGDTAPFTAAGLAVVNPWLAT